MRSEVEFIVITLQRRTQGYKFAFPSIFSLHEGDFTVFSENVMYDGISITNLKGCSQWRTLQKTLDLLISMCALRW